MGIGGDGERYLLEMKAHRLGVAERQDQARGLARGRADRAEDVARLGPLVVRRRGSRAAQRPAAGDLVLLADPGFVGEPDFYALARARADCDLRQAGGERFLKATAASGFCA